ncbi:MAG: peptidase MA family metallohydrolase [Candidatus Sumerlaeota bacterium]|nr:peptidase MA family metallohydrolase [Candidatus Sumerlaeota bacterium]
MITKHCFHALFAAFCSACLWASSSFAVGESAIDLNNRGVEQLGRGEFAAAAATLKAAYEMNNEDALIRKNYSLALNNWALSLVKEGSGYPPAVKLLEQARQVAPDSEEIAQNLSATRSNWAVAYSANHEYADAEKMFVKAFETAPESTAQVISHSRAENLVAYAQAEQARGRKADARKLLETALTINPDSVSALVESGKLLYEAGESEEALSHWQRALELQPDVPGLAERTAKLQREIETEGGFTKRQNLYFRVSYDGAANDDAAQVVLGILTQARREIGKDLQLYPSNQIQVVLYNKDQFAHVTMAPHWSGGLYDGKIRVPISQWQRTPAKLEALRAMLNHEYAHVLVLLIAGPKIPSWFNEGLATYYELELRERQTRYEGEWKRCRDLQAANQLPAIKSLPEQFTSIRDDEQAKRAYMVARTFAAWLGGGGRAYKFRTVLEEINKGATMDVAFKATFGYTIEQMEATWHGQLRRGL